MTVERCNYNDYVKKVISNPLTGLYKIQRVMYARGDGHVTVNMDYVYNPFTGKTYIWFVPTGYMHIGFDGRDYLVLKAKFKGHIYHEDTDKDTFEPAFETLDEWYARYSVLIK